MKDHQLATSKSAIYIYLFYVTCMSESFFSTLQIEKAHWRKYPQDGGVCILDILIVSKGTPIFDF